MNKVLEYFMKNQQDLRKQNIKVYGWQNSYNHIIIPSITKYLFEDLNIINNLAPLTNENRPGNIKEKKYITVHDTGDADKNHTAKFWSETVKNQHWEQGPYAASYQYVVDNEGIYQQIPDEEVAWHAGDTTKYDYTLYDSGVFGTNEFPTVTISEDGYYVIDGEISILFAPRIYHEKEGKILKDRTPRTKDICDQGVLCKLIDGKYYIGETYYNTTYDLIANRGGNNNSIGIESCINEGSDIYYTWHKTAKLVAHLMDKHQLTLNDVKQHHYFSGKNCPETIRMNNKWEHFLSLVAFEYQIIKFKKEGYLIELISDDPNLLKNGRLKYNRDCTIKFTIKTTYQGIVETQDFTVNI